MTHTRMLLRHVIAQRKYREVPDGLSTVGPRDHAGKPNL